MGSTPRRGTYTSPLKCISGNLVCDDSSDSRRVVLPIDIKGVRLVSLDWNTIDSNINNEELLESAFLIKDFDEVLIGRAPQSHVIVDAHGVDQQMKQRPLPTNSWVLPCPVMSREHAVLKLRNDKVSTQPRCLSPIR